MTDRETYKFIVPVKWIPSNIKPTGEVIIKGEHKGKILLNGDLVDFYRFQCDSEKKFLMKASIMKYLESCGIGYSYFPY